jgi:hypothetical protein
VRKFLLLPYIRRQFFTVRDYIDLPASGQVHGWANAGRLAAEKKEGPQAFCMGGDAGD